MPKQKQKDWSDLGPIGLAIFILMATAFSLSRFDIDYAIDTLATGFLYALGAIILGYAVYLSGILSGISSKLFKKSRRRR